MRTALAASWFALTSATIPHGPPSSTTSQTSQLHSSRSTIADSRTWVQPNSPLSPAHTPYYVFAADSRTLGGEHTLLVVDRHHEPGRWFRVALPEAASVEANLAIANMDLSDFADATDETNVFRGFV